MYNQWAIIAIKKRYHMKAMILAAGLGTRLRPLTSKKPKALVPVGNKAVIDRVIHYLMGHNISEIIVNAHHHHQQIVNYLDGNRSFGINIQVRIEPEILGTGGGIKNVTDFWRDEPFIVMNADIMTNIDLLKALKVHSKNKNLATLILHNYKPFNQLLINNRFNIVDISSEDLPDRLAFTGIHIIEPELLNYIPDEVYSNIITCYQKLIGLGKPISAHVSNKHYWRDIGTVSSYVLANKEALQGKPFLMGQGSQIHSTAKLEDWAIIGEKNELEEDVEIRRSILWENVTVKKGRKVIDSIVTSSKQVRYDIINKIY